MMLTKHLNSYDEVLEEVTGKQLMPEFNLSETHF